MASILAGIYCLREKQWSTLPGELMRIPLVLVLALPCLAVGGVGSGGWSGQWELWVLWAGLIRLFVFAWSRIAASGALCLGPAEGVRAACSLFLEIFSLYVHITESHWELCCKPLQRTEAEHPSGRGAVQKAGTGRKDMQKGSMRHPVA